MLGAALMAAGVPPSGCTPIPAPDRGRSDLPRVVPVQRGDPLPDFALFDVAGNPVGATDLRGEVIVLTFAAPGAPFVDELLDRLALVERRLAGGSETRFVVCALDGDARSAAALGAGRPPDWLVLTSPRGQVADLAARFGVMTWTEDDRLAHTLRVVVVGPSGHITDMLEGLSPWSVEDLLASVTAAS